MPEPEENHRLHMLVKGRVQNVGFRAHVEVAGRQYRLTGWVRNVGYDTVETVAEGPRQQLEEFAELVRAGPTGSRVDDASLEWLTPTGEFTSFVVRRSA